MQSQPDTQRSSQWRAELIARVLLTVGALVPYWPLLTFAVVFVTDDVFTSDIFNGELPGRVLMGDLIRQGELPIWTSRLCSGIVLAGVSEPIGLASFAALPAAAALDLFLVVMLLVAAHGAYSLARRMDASRAGAVLAGIAFAGSGYFAAQLKHLAIVSTVVWLPLALVCLDRAFGDARDHRPPTMPRRLLYVGAFGLIFAEQVLSGFPQSAYICAMAYGAFALFRAWDARQRWNSVRAPLALMAASGVAVILASAAGAVSWIPLLELGELSDRNQTLGWMWSTTVPYWPWNGLTFLAPYIHGDVSNNTYQGRSLFWEDYGYVGIATFLLAMYGAAREWRRPMVGFVAAMTVVAYLMVLGRSSYVFWLAYHVVPGLSTFRFPTRFLILVELGLALLAAVGLTRLGRDLERRASTTMPIVPTAVVVGVCVLTVADLLLHQPRQNPMVDARTWLQAPVTVERVRAGTTHPRTFTVEHGLLHRLAFQEARGWANVAPYFQLRDVLQPNVGSYWNTPSADCYAGVAPTWHVDVWGDHNRPGLIAGRLAGIDLNAGTLRVHPEIVKVLGAYGVTHLVSAFPAATTAPLPAPQPAGSAHVYPIEGGARVRVVTAARHVANSEDAAARVLHEAFDPDREVLLHDAPLTVAPIASESSPTPVATSAARARIVSESAREVVVEAMTDADAFLVLADTFYPGWVAEIDGRRVPIYRANVSVRGIQLPKGQHHVRFLYEARSYMRGLTLTVVAIVCLGAWMGVAWFFDRRSRRRTDVG